MIEGKKEKDKKKENIENKDKTDKEKEVYRCKYCEMSLKK